MDGRGFTLVEVLVAMVVATIVSGTVYLLVDAGLEMHDRGTEVGLDATGFATTVSLLRADVARTHSITHVESDSLVLELADGRAVEWTGRVVADGIHVYRSIDSGSGFVEHPKWPVVELHDGPALGARVLFSVGAGDRVRADLRSDDHDTAVEARPWRTP